MSDAATEAAGQGGAEEQEAGLLDQIVDVMRVGPEPTERARGRGLVKRFIQEVLDENITISEDMETMITSRIADIDRLLSSQLDAILHHPDFQRLESTWRGLKYLLDQTSISTSQKIRVLNVSKKDLLNDFKRAPEFDQSQLFKKVYGEQFGTLGGEPFGALLGDFYFGPGGQDVSLMDDLSLVAAAAHAPLITGTDASMFGLESYSELPDPRDLAKIFDNDKYAKWKAFRDKEDSRYVALTLPRMLLREPYGSETVPVEAFNYEEGVDGRDHGRYLWGNAAWALGARVNQAFFNHGWCATIRGVESGGLVEDLPLHMFDTESGDRAMKCPTEVPITDRRENELAGLGFAPLCHVKGTTKAAFISVQSAQKPKQFMEDAANANAQLSAQIPYIFAVSRFAHYLKVMMRDKIGGYMSRSQAEAFLNKWITNYVVGNDDASAKVKAERPLRQARIDVEEIPGKPGSYRAVAFLKPHFQLDALNVSLRLVADLPERGSS